MFINVIGAGQGLAFYFGGGRAATWLLTLSVFMAIFAIAGFTVKSRWDGIFIDQDNRISLSRLQIVLWTISLVSCLFTAGLTNSTRPMLERGPLEIDIPEQIWALLGLGAFTAVAAPAIKDTKRGASTQVNAGGQLAAANQVRTDQRLSGTPTFDGEVLVKETAQDARWLDLIQGDYAGSSHVDTSKLQQLSFTVLLLSIYAVAIWRTMSSGGQVTQLPPLDGGFLAMLAISHAAYLADKQIATT